MLVADVDADTGKVATDALAEIGPADFVATDITSPSRSPHAAGPRRSTASGGLDILVNNAAASYGNWNMGDNSYEYLRTVFEVNQHGVWLMSRAAAPHMVEGGGGRIINQSSGAAYNYRGAVTPPEEFAGLGSFSYQQT